MENSQLIAKLKELKNVSPRKEWVSLAKMRMFEIAPVIPAQKASFMGFFPKKQFAYSFAAILVIAVGVYGLINFPVPSGVNSLAMEADLKNGVEILKVKSQNLSAVPKNQTKDISIALQEVKIAAKNITETIKKDPQLASKVALEVNNNKTYLDVAGGNASSEVSDMYQAIVVQMIKDLDGTTLTKDQQVELDRIKASLKIGNDYTTALRDILLISRAGEAK